MIGGLDVPTSGQVVVDGKELSKLKDEELTVFRRRKIGFIFQNYNLVPVLNVYENIVLPVELDGNKVDKKFMKEVVQMLGLEDKLKNMPNNLSGGQQQRVAIARALVSKPAIVLADEPTGNLDSRTSADVLGLLQRTSREFNQTLVMITHNDAIAQLADRIASLNSIPFLLRNGKASAIVLSFRDKSAWMESLTCGKVNTPTDAFLPTIMTHQQETSSNFTTSVGAKSVYSMI